MLIDSSEKWEVWRVRDHTGPMTMMLDTIKYQNAVDIAMAYADEERVAAQRNGRGIRNRFYVCKAITVRHQGEEVT